MCFYQKVGKFVHQHGHILFAFNSPISQYERLRLPVPHVSTKPLKSSLSLHAKIDPFLHLK